MMECSEGEANERQFGNFIHHGVQIEGGGAESNIHCLV